MNKQAIGFLDSGVGGLTVAKAVIDYLPNEEICYIGDSARNPYGPRPMDEVLEFSRQLAHFLLQKNIKLLVIACNTATVASLEVLKKELPIPVIGVTAAGSKIAAITTRNNKIGVLGTEGTIQSGEYERKILKANQAARIKNVASPTLVSIVENNQFEGEQACQAVASELKDFKDSDIDTLVLACTHYPLLRPLIQEYLGQTVELVDPGLETAKAIGQYLTDNHLQNNEKTESMDHRFYTTGSVDKFKKVAFKWLQTNQLAVEYIPVKELIVNHE